jgi:hypothetical protein
MMPDDIEDKRTPVIGVTLKSSVDMAEVAYNLGWRAAISASIELMTQSDLGPDAFSLMKMMKAMQAMPVEPSPSIEKMKAALE